MNVRVDLHVGAYMVKMSYMGGKTCFQNEALIRACHILNSRKDDPIRVLRMPRSLSVSQTLHKGAKTQRESDAYSSGSHRCWKDPIRVHDFKDELKNILLPCLT